MRRLRNILGKRTGQTLIEYALIVGLAVAAITALSTYASRAVTSKQEDIGRKVAF